MVHAAQITPQVGHAPANAAAAHILHPAFTWMRYAMPSSSPTCGPTLAPWLIASGSSSLATAGPYTARMLSRRVAEAYEGGGEGRGAHMRRVAGVVVGVGVGQATCCRCLRVHRAWRDNAASDAAGKPL